MGAFDPELEDLVRRLNAERPGSSAHASALVAAPEPPEIDAAASAERLEALDRLLRRAAEAGASDLLLTAGSPPTLRVQGLLRRERGEPLSATEVRALTMPLLDAQTAERLRERLSVDFSFSRSGLGRFRANLHFQRGTLAAALRVLPREIPTLEALHLPPSLGELAERPNGLILVTGSAGSGKTTTLAALIGRINRRRACHVITIEDPIEYDHVNDQALIEQLDVGRDVLSFAEALRSALRQSPDVILVGEMRDRETMAAALTAAETGHLVFATLHTNDAVRAIGRIIDAFPADQHGQVRQQLSLSLAAVIAQRLAPSVDGRSRYPAVELLINTPAVANLVRRGEDHLLRSQLSLGRAQGMVAMEDSLAKLAQAGRISEETVRAYAPRTE